MATEEFKQEKQGITIIENEGKLYFSDEFYNGNLNHPLNIPSENQ